MAIQIFWTKLHVLQIATILAFVKTQCATKTLLKFWFIGKEGDDEATVNERKNTVGFGTTPPDPETMQRPKDRRPESFTITVDAFEEWWNSVKTTTSIEENASGSKDEQAEENASGS